MKTPFRFADFCGRVFLVLCLFVVLVRPAFAYDDPPMRVARLNYVEGEVSFQPGGETDWGWATLNRPLTTGDSLWTGDRSRAEMHIGSTAIRVGEQTSVSFLNLDDRTVQIQLNSGTIDVRLRNLYGDDVFEVDTPNLAFTVLRRGDYRITADPEGSFTTITLRDGQGQIDGGGQAFLVDGGSQVQVSGTDYISYDIYDLPDRDNFDRWSYSRQLREEHSRSARYVSPELTGSEDLDRNGIWRTDPNYGPVWVPTHVSQDWAPYREGHWAWVDPWGWTWVDDSPSGFVTSHYGRWAHVDGGYGGGGWVWVPPHREAHQDVYAQRPVYSPALVTFVGDSNSPRDFGNGGGVAWVPLAPGEVYVPAHQTSPTYVTNVNVTNTVVQQTTITNVVNNNNVQTTTYVNQNVAGAVTAVPRTTFVNAQPVAQAAVKVAPSAITAAPAVHSAPVAPVRASVMGANKASTASATVVSAPPKPPTAVATRAVVAKVAPPPPPVAFAQKQQAMQANPGKPLDAKAVQNLRAATPPPVVRVVQTVPPAQAVKPVETAAKKPQPATSLNTAQQAHPPSPGAPAAPAGSQQAAQQQQAAEKAKQETVQQQAAQLAAAEKAKQQTAQQQAAQQAAAEKAKLQTAQQQAAAEKAKQETAQQQAAQLAAAEKAKLQTAQQQAAAEKAKQETAQQQAAQQAAAEKAKLQTAQQQAAAEKAKQETAQQQAAQLAAAEKAKQQTAQQQLAAEKAKQEAAQQQAAQQAAAEKAKQQTAQMQAVAEKTKQEAAQQAAETARQQQLAQGRPPSNPNARPPSGAPPSNPPAAANNGPVRVAENVQAAKLISQPRLNYPPDAKAAHIQGTVRVQTLIGADGRVKNATVLSGPQLLQAPALENARLRLYKPTIVDGKPVEVETEISIVF
jgi:TonB family protein